MRKVSRCCFVIVIEENDQIVNPLGIKGLGEIGIVGVAVAIAIAVFHATGSATTNWRSHWTRYCEKSWRPDLKWPSTKHEEMAMQMRP
jgi:hypothetical protein